MGPEGVCVCASACVVGDTSAGLSMLFTISTDDATTESPAVSAVKWSVVAIKVEK